MKTISGQRCAKVRADGVRCRTTFGINPENGLCYSHDPRRKTERKQAQQRGAETTNRRHRAPGVDTGDWRLESFADAQAWLFRIGKAVLAGDITHNQATAATRAVESWMKAYQGGEVTQELTQTTALLNEIKRALRGSEDARESLRASVH